MKRHKPRALTLKEQKKMWPRTKVFMMDEICTVCGAIRRQPFLRGVKGKWEKDGMLTPWCPRKK